MTSEYYEKKVTWIKILYKTQSIIAFIKQADFEKNFAIFQDTALMFFSLTNSIESGG